MALGWVIAAVVMAITIVGLPWARAGSASPSTRCCRSATRPYFRREDVGTGPLGVIGNIVWLLLAGWWLALGHLSKMQREVQPTAALTRIALIVTSAAQNRRCRPLSQIRGGIGCTRAGHHPGLCQRERGGAAAGKPPRADRVRECHRSGRRRVRREPSAAGRQRHRVHFVRVRHQPEMAGAAHAIQPASFKPRWKSGHKWRAGGDTREVEPKPSGLALLRQHNTRHLLVGIKMRRPNSARGGEDTRLCSRPLGELHGRNLASALMRSRVHNRTRDRGGKPIRLEGRGIAPGSFRKDRGLYQHS
jgi:hypothetical protein